MLESKNELHEFMIPIKIKVRNQVEVMNLETVSIPVNWIDALSFNGDGFSVTVNLPREIVFPKGSTIKIEFGTIGRSESEAPPPFDPPYLSRVKKREDERALCSHGKEPEECAECTRPLVV